MEQIYYDKAEYLIKKRLEYFGENVALNQICANSHTINELQQSKQKESSHTWFYLE